MNNDFDNMCLQLKNTYKSLNKEDQISFINKIKSLINYHNEPADYPELNDEEIQFPETLTIAYAVCHPECGCQELIVEGSSQMCQYCGSTMFRCEKRVYKKE